MITGIFKIFTLTLIVFCTPGEKYCYSANIHPITRNKFHLFQTLCTINNAEKGYQLPDGLFASFSQNENKKNVPAPGKRNNNTLAFNFNELYNPIYLITLNFIVILVIVFYLILHKNRKYNQTLKEQLRIIDQKNQLLLDNMKYAKIIQKAFLPSHGYFQKIFPDSFIISIPQNHVNGDFIWYHQSRDYKIAALVDCTGHGIPASLLSIIGNNLLNIIVKEYGLTSPSKVLKNLDILLKKEFENGDEDPSLVESMDISICYIADSKIIYSGALMPVILASKERCHLYKGNMDPLGGYIIQRQKRFADTTIYTEKGDRLYLFSDGYYDQFGGENGKPLRIKNFLELVNRAQSIPITGQKAFFEDELAAWMKGYDQIDDISLVGIELD